MLYQLRKRNKVVSFGLLIWSTTLLFLYRKKRWYTLNMDFLLFCLYKCVYRVKKALSVFGGQRDSLHSDHQTKTKHFIYVIYFLFYWSKILLIIQTMSVFIVRATCATVLSEFSVWCLHFSSYIWDFMHVCLQPKIYQWLYVLGLFSQHCLFSLKKQKHVL